MDKFISIVSPVIHQRLNQYINNVILPAQNNPSIYKVVLCPVLFFPTRQELSCCDSFSKLIFARTSSNASQARNIGITLVINTVDERDMHLHYAWFADDDCSLQLQNPFTKVTPLSESPQVYLFKLKDPLINKIVGKSLNTSSLLVRYSALFYGAPSIVISLQNVPLFSEHLGPGTNLYSAEDTDFLIKAVFSCGYKVILLDDVHLHHPLTIFTTDKIYKYGVGQGYVFASLLFFCYGFYPSLPILAFFIFILRPFIGLLLSICTLNIRYSTLYIYRLMGLASGVFLFLKSLLRITSTFKCN